MSKVYMIDNYDSFRFSRVLESIEHSPIQVLPTLSLNSPLTLILQKDSIYFNHHLRCDIKKKVATQYIVTAFRDQKIV